MQEIRRSVSLDDERFSAMSNVLGMLAHDFNNLLTPFLAYPSMVKDDLSESSNGRALLDVMEKTAKDMAHITKQLLELASKENGDRHLLDLNLVVGEAVDAIRRDLSSDKITIETDFSSDACLVTGSEEQIGCLVNNLCMNAVESMRQEGKLLVRTERSILPDGTYVRITVKDTGSGISSKAVDHIFEPFFTTKKDAKCRGAGLGLSIVYRIVKGHGGHVDFQTIDGGGTTFNVYLHADKSSGSKVEKISVDDVSPATLGDMTKCNKDRILIVDDEKTILKLFQMILSSGLTGYKIDAACNGVEAVKLFDEGHHCLLIMDLHMPVMDGQAAFFKIEENCKQKGWEMPPVVFCTGFAPPDSIRGVLEGNSPHRLLSKPISGEILLETVKSRLAR